MIKSSWDRLGSLRIKDSYGTVCGLMASTNHCNAGIFSADVGTTFDAYCTKTVYDFDEDPLLCVYAM